MEEYESNVNDFKDVVGIILNNWTGLKLAIEHGMAGGFGVIIGKKLDIFLGYILNEAFSRNSELELENLLDDTMDSLFATVLEDDSTQELALLIKSLATKWQNGERDDAYEYVSSLTYKNNILTTYPGHPSSNFQKTATNNRKQANVMTTTLVESNPTIDNSCEHIDDGWQIVKNKKR